MSELGAQIEMERSVLSEAFWLGTAVPGQWAASLEPHHFTVKDHQTLISAIQDLVAREESVDVSTVKDRIESWGTPFPGTLVEETVDDACGCANLENSSRRLIERYQIRTLKEIAKRAAEIPDACTIDEAAEIVGDMARALRPVVASGGPIGTKQLLMMIEDYAKDAIQSGGRAIKTKIQILDAELGMEPGDMTILGARPSQGKSTLCGQIALAASAEGHVLLFSLEMSAIAFGRRMLATLSGKPLDQINAAVVGGTIVPAMSELYACSLAIDERSGLSVDAMRSVVMRHPDTRLIVVDYLQLMDTKSDVKEQYLRIGQIGKGLKRMAKEFNCHVLVLSQLNRNSETRGSPRLSDLRDSGNLEEDADNVLLIHRPGEFDKTIPKTVSRLEIAKQRHGPTTAFDLSWDAARMRFK